MGQTRKTRKSKKGGTRSLSGVSRFSFTKRKNTGKKYQFKSNPNYNGPNEVPIWRRRASFTGKKYQFKSNPNYNSPNAVPIAQSPIVYQANHYVSNSNVPGPSPPGPPPPRAWWQRRNSPNYTRYTNHL